MYVRMRYGIGLVPLLCFVLLNGSIAQAEEVEGDFSSSELFAIEEVDDQTSVTDYPDDAPQDGEELNELPNAEIINSSINYSGIIAGDAGASERNVESLAEWFANEGPEPCGPVAEGVSPDVAGPQGEPEEQPGEPEEQPGEPEEQPGEPEEQPGEPEEQPGEPEEQPGEPEEQPGEPEEQPGEPEEQPGEPEEQPGEPEEQPGEPEEQPGEPEEQPGEPEEQPAGALGRAAAPAASPAPAGAPDSWLSLGGLWYRYGADGRLAPKGWLVTGAAPSGASGALERYWIGEGGALARSGLVDDPQAGWLAYATGDGRVVRGSWTDPSTGYVYLADNDGRLAGGESGGWVVTGDYSGGELQRYWVDPESHACEPGFSEGGWAHETRPDTGAVVRGSWTDPSTGYVYLADNDGRLAGGESGGWVVTGDYSGGELQRYWVDPESHACEPGFSEGGWAHYTTASGAVLRGALQQGGSRLYADNDGRLAEGWVVTGAFTGGALERYWFDGGRAASGRLVGPSEGDASGYYAWALPDGRVLRGSLAREGGVYLADNDGRLLGGLSGGWAVTGAFSGGELQRYWVDPQSHAARTGIFTISKKESPALHGTFQGQKDAGYVVRNVTFKLDGQTYKTDNEGRISFALKMLVALDPGHGGADGGAEGIGGLTESDINWKIAQACKNKLEELGATVVMTRDKNEEVSILDRVNRAKEMGAFLVVSLHNNYSESAGVHGSEVLIPNDSSYNNDLHRQGVTLANSILTNLETLGLSNRGLVERDYPLEGDEGGSVYDDGSVADYYGITRYARRNGMLGIIVEHGFMSNPADANRLASDAFLKSLGDADARGIFAVYKDELTIEAEGNPIMGISMSKSSQLVDAYGQSGHSYPTELAAKGAPTIDKFCDLVVETAQAEGVRAEVVFSQAMWETGWLSFGNLVKASQCNFAGIGATGNINDTTGGKGCTFADVRTGLLAQAQHLKAYASKKDLNTSRVDPRFDYVERGCAPTVEGLGGKWAVGEGSESYGNNIVNIMRRVLDE